MYHKISIDHHCTVLHSQNDKSADKTLLYKKEKYVKKTDSILTRKIPHLSPIVAEQVKVGDKS